MPVPQFASFALRRSRFAARDLELRGKVALLGPYSENLLQGQQSAALKVSSRACSSALGVRQSVVLGHVARVLYLVVRTAL
jgi:hypothetical protein